MGFYLPQIINRKKTYNALKIQSRISVDFDMVEKF